VTATPDARAAGERIEFLLCELRRIADERTCAKVEELLGAVLDLYGAGLARVLDLMGEPARRHMAEDDLVASLMHIHGLHPDSLAVRVERALAKVRPLLARHGGGVDLLDVDEAAAAVLLRLQGNCSGCPSSLVTLRQAVEKAVLEEAPEVLAIDVEQDESVEVRITAKPRYVECPSEVTV
jgi:Fe-S cluster biogenesis protein NfuA